MSFIQPSFNFKIIILIGTYLLLSWDNHRSFNPSRFQFIWENIKYSFLVITVRAILKFMNRSYKEVMLPN